MTREEKIEAFTMRVDGATYQEISNKFGVTKQCIEQMLRPRDRKRPKISKQCIYSGLAQYIKDNNLTYSKLEKIMGVNSVTTVSKKIKGKTLFTIVEIERILEKTGMTFEECFKKKAPEAGTSKGKNK